MVDESPSKQHRLSKTCHMKLGKVWWFRALKLYAALIVSSYMTVHPIAWSTERPKGLQMEGCPTTLK